MGITQQSIDRLIKFDCLKSNSTMLELGCQNLYVEGRYLTYAIDYFKSLGILCESWDLCGCNNSKVVDLSILIDNIEKQYSIITDFGTTEHVKDSLYNAFKNIHNLCEVGGLIIHENPLVGHWHNHGYNYFTKEFYVELCKDNQYELLDLEIEYAMGNYTDGGLVCSVFRKTKEQEFISEKTFKTYYTKRILFYEEPK
jgi:hypothetical protein